MFDQHYPVQTITSQLSKKYNQIIENVIISDKFLPES